MEGGGREKGKGVGKEREGHPPEQKFWLEP